MKFSPDLFKVVDHCQHRSFITNKYSGARIAVDCGQCDYCIHKKAQKASMHEDRRKFFQVFLFCNAYL